jgi:adhesin/invasin
MKLIFLKRALLALAAMFVLTGMVACEDDDDVTGPDTPAAIAATTPAPPATAQVATAVQGPSVTVTDADGGPAVGVLVNFDVTGGGGALQYPVASTNDQGVASAGFWQIGPTVGANTATAEVTGLPPVSFSVTSTPGPASRISFSAGNAQEAAPNTALPTPLAIRLTDAGGNPKPGETVTFTVTSGGGSITGGTATSNAQGIATSGTWTIGNCRGQTVRATSGSLNITFTAAATGQPAIATGGTTAGTLDTTDCNIDGAYADEYALTTAAEAVNITLTAATFDALLNVLNAAATAPIATNDNSTGTNSAIKLLSAATTKTLTATTAVDGQTGPYTLSVTNTTEDVGSCGTVFIEPGVTTNQAIATTDCSTHNGTTADGYMLYIPAGGTVRISMSSNPVDALIELYSPAGELLAQRDALGVSASSEVLTFTASTAGYYKVVAAAYGLVFDDEYGAEYGAYVLNVVIP